MQLYWHSFVFALTCVVTSWAQLPATHCDIICDEEKHEEAACGSDGKLYTSSCEFHRTQCLTQQNGGNPVTVISVGACVTADTSCDVTLQTKCIPGAVIGSTGIPEQVEPICGSDSVTYDSMCEFRTRQCQLLAAPPEAGFAPLDLSHIGKCDSTDLANATAVNCTKYVTVVTGVAIEGTHQNAMHTRPCNKIYNPVCGLNGQTYGNWCMFCSYLVGTRQLDTDLIGYMAHPGRCVGDGLFG